MDEPTTTSAEMLPKAPAIKIIRAGEDSVWRDAYRFLAEAKQIYASEREKGYADGMAASSQEASQLVHQTAMQVDRYLASLEKDVAKLAFDIVKRVLNEFDDAELVARAARNALTDFRDAKLVRIKIHPSAEASLKKVLSERGGDDAQSSPRIVIETDEDLNKDSCILSTDFAIVEATVDAQLAAIAEAMGLSRQNLPS